MNGDVYVLGVDALPPEISKKIMPYQTISGGCGFELWGKYGTCEGHVGDLLIVTEDGMFIRRAEEQIRM